MKKKHTRERVLVAAVTVSLLMTAMLAVSCGVESQPEQEGGTARKYPPGTSEEMLSETTGSGGLALEGGNAEPAAEEGESEAESIPVAGAAAVELAGARFTVVEAARQDSNADVITSGQREVPGDYYEIELLVENVGDDIVDLSEYSFRIWSEGISAGDYEDYYGMTGVFGDYVSENMISATLLDYTTLQPAAYKLKAGETVEGVFLFFDLSPKRAARNEGVTGVGTNLVFHKSRGDDSGEDIEINLAAYPD